MQQREVRVYLLDALQELDQHVDVAARREILAKHAAEQTEPRDRVPPAEVGDLRDRGVDW